MTSPFSEHAAVLIIDCTQQRICYVSLEVCCCVLYVKWKLSAGRSKDVGTAGGNGGARSRNAATVGGVSILSPQQYYAKFISWFLVSLSSSF